MIVWFTVSVESDTVDSPGSEAQADVLASTVSLDVCMLLVVCIALVSLTESTECSLSRK